MARGRLAYLILIAAIRIYILRIVFVICNAYRCNTTNRNTFQVLQTTGESGPSNSDSEDTPLVAPLSTSPDRLDTTCRYYIICDKIEMGQMAAIFFNRFGTTLFYLCFAIYLYGDLSIYGAAIAKSLADVACTYLPKNLTCNDTVPDTELCWEGSTFTRLVAYRIFLVCHRFAKFHCF